MKRLFHFFTLLALGLALGSCNAPKQQSKTTDPVDTLQVPTFITDSAYQYILQQCAFGPRVPGTEAHRRTAAYIAQYFRNLGLTVTEQKAQAKAYDGTMLTMNNIQAAYKPELTQRILICAHWDSRPWADNDPDPANHRKPVMAANDGASGVAIMMAVAQVLTQHNPTIGIDFVALDAEDYGTPQWADTTGQDNSDTWCLGSQYWAQQARQDGYRPLYGILLDMVGGKDARFYQEGFSLQYASNVVDMVWQAAARAGYAEHFPQQPGGYITDDHEVINRLGGIPCIDIIPYYPNHPSSTFGPTWHTVHDTPENIDKTTLQAVGQTLLQVIYETL